MTTSKSSFTRKVLRATFQLGEGTFGEGKLDEIAFSGLRMSADIFKGNNRTLSTMNLRIWGLTQGHMNRLAKLRKPILKARRNKVMLEAGDSETGLSKAYEGVVNTAWADYNAMPQVMFVVDSISTLFDQMKPLPPTSFRGSTDAAQTVRGIATQMGWTFENNGVDAKLADPYLPGTGMDQIRRVADSAGFNWSADNGTIAIWPRKGSRGGEVPIISPDSGQIVYPTFTERGIALRVQYDPAVKLGGKIEVKSDLPEASGQWQVVRLSYVLESEMPGGQWMMQIECVPVGQRPGFR